MGGIAKYVCVNQRLRSGNYCQGLAGWHVAPREESGPGEGEVRELVHRSTRGLDRAASELVSRSRSRCMSDVRLRTRPSRHRD